MQPVPTHLRSGWVSLALPTGQPFSQDPSLMWNPSSEGMKTRKGVDTENRWLGQPCVPMYALQRYCSCLALQTQIDGLFPARCRQFKTKKIYPERLLGYYSFHQNGNNTYQTYDTNSALELWKTPFRSSLILLLQRRCISFQLTAGCLGMRWKTQRSKLQQSCKVADCS